MNLSYRCKHLNLGEGIHAKEPIIPVTFLGNNGIRLNFTAILDSGSDLVLLPIEVAEVLELDFNRSNAEEAKVYSGDTITTAFSNVNIRIEKGHEKTIVTCRCAIQLERNREHEHIIFGSSFFEHFKIEFDYPNNRFQIKK